MAQFKHRAPNATKLPDFRVRADSDEQTAAQVARRLNHGHPPLTEITVDPDIQGLRPGDVITIGDSYNFFRIDVQDGVITFERID